MSWTQLSAHSCSIANSPDGSAMQTSRAQLCYLRWVLFFGTILLTGCGAKVLPVSDVDRATLLMNETLSEWQAGASLDEQRAKNPPVYVAEELWLNGTKLDKFEIAEPGELFGTNVRFGVKLSCIEKSGDKRSREVKYVVTTSPALTIAREDR